MLHTCQGHTAMRLSAICLSAKLPHCLFSQLCHGYAPGLSPSRHLRRNSVRPGKDIEGIGEYCHT